jgi:HTH-type transcriptional repressor of NAD biosynthesis genes
VTFPTGLVIGKFLPPHRGHHHLIDAAAAQSQRVFVVVCEHPEQGLPSSTRVACLRERHPQAEIVVVPDVVPADDSVGWANYTLRTLGFRPDAVFTSEDYGDAYAAALGARHVLVDRARAAVPCSGTMIRKDPLAHLQWLSPFMRALYVRRVCAVGAESTGTTTLAAALAARYATVWVPEYGREYCARKWKDGYTAAWSTDEFVHIAEEQSRREDDAARTANRVLVCDTDAFATAIWHERYLGARSPAVDRIAGTRFADLYFLTGDEIPFVQDGLRDGEHVRHAMQATFARELAASGRRFVRLQGTPEARLAEAAAHVEALLREPVRSRDYRPRPNDTTSVTLRPPRA